MTQVSPTTYSSSPAYKFTWNSCLFLYALLCQTPGGKHLCTHLGKLPNLPSFLCLQTFDRHHTSSFSLPGMPGFVLSYHSEPYSPCLFLL